MPGKPELLIEKWLPVDFIGAESMRERGASSALPPLYFLHVWWARRPLTASRAAILASVLPAWSEDWPGTLKQRFPTEDAYKAWFLRACGIFGDPVAGRKLIKWANERNIKLKQPPYSHKRAFTVNPAPDMLETIGDLLEHAWGNRQLAVLDPFSGGGSIPFEALRYGFTTYANELNPVASVILKATLDYPFRFGPSLAEDTRKYGKLLCDRVREKLEPFFPIQPGESIHAYIWARTVKCPYTGKPIPLSPNWWLRTGTKPVVVRPIFNEGVGHAHFEILEGHASCVAAKPDEGTVRRGNAVSPWAQNQPVDGDYIKAEAQAGRMGQQLYAVAVKRHDGLSFRVPTREDEEAVSRAESAFRVKLPGWEAKGLIPTEPRTEGRADWSARIYGMNRWCDTFSPRQLLALCTFVEELRCLDQAMRVDLATEPGRADAVTSLLGIALDKAADYNAVLTTWESTRQIVKHVFKRHDLGFSWSFGEFDASRNLFPWVIDQVADAFAGLAKLAVQDRPLLGGAQDTLLHISQGNAGDISTIPSATVRSICTDPPYYDNVSYSDCSNFFYVWLKRSVGDLYPGWFRDELTNSEDEAVANVARFASMGRRKGELALADYERKMAAAFREMHRALTDDGVLTVMFTHKKVEAWDTLATSLIGAGFVIKSSWPVHTESEHSLHQAKKNAAQSTILLSCRKREKAGEPVWWDDLKGQVRRAAKEKAQEFEQLGIKGVDLYISTFGPVLSILSENWPVLTSEVDERTGQPKPLRPEIALDIAREEVVALRRRGLLLGRQVQFDPFTDWYLMAWDAFKAEEFPGDEARKLAIALGMDLERQVVAQKKLVMKKGSTVVLLQPDQRRQRGMVDPNLTAFDCWVDAAHTAMLLYKEDGAGACETFLKQAGLMTDGTFKACLQAMINAIPRTKVKGKFVRPESEVLESLRLAFFDDLVVPAEEAPPQVQVQLELGFSGGKPDESAGAEESDESEDGEGEEE